ncbi:phosphoenolpyruvate synthase [Salsuginibacillus halophilus]|uniref:Phosphoenolpyruvate synthase n=1 Tax=Salsuginibacillus halophilus TaxID=517424 RepID=A0A2P8HG97_9BACI|nr:phenylalanine--tRNA ligase beta subunit-related protein [Salsuginibacillus halophilus]PSL45220.1 phosphoenolpyruvate synthase [Salsuginibacillus halophilus]
MNVSIAPPITAQVPDFKIAVLSYEDITIGPSPQMLRGRLDFFQENIKADLLDHEITAYEGVREWREVFQTLGISPSKYRPSHEALFRRVAKHEAIPNLHSAVDINNFFSLQYEFPSGIYDTDQLQGAITLRFGREDETFTGINGRSNRAAGKIVTADDLGPFGSPIVDSERTKTTENTTRALQIFYLQPSLSVNQAAKLADAAAGMFTQLHGGNASVQIIPAETKEHDA